MRHKFNFEVMILVLMLVGLLDFNLWKKVDPNTIATDEKETSCLIEVGNTNRNSVKEDVNNKVGILNTLNQQPQSVFSFHFIQDKITKIFAVVNPDKLKII